MRVERCDPILWNYELFPDYSHRGPTVTRSTGLRTVTIFNNVNRLGLLYTILYSIQEVKDETQILSRLQF